MDYRSIADPRTYGSDTRLHELLSHMRHNDPVAYKPSRKRSAQGAALRTLIHMDEPDQKVFRSLTQDWFMPANLKLVEQKVEQIAERFVDRMLETGGECDFVNDVAVWYRLRQCQDRNRG